MALAWRYFPMMALREAQAWARRPGCVALHHTGQAFRRWRFTCHLWACDEATLCRAARAIGVNVKWIQRKPGNVHFDVFGMPLIAALRRVDNPDIMVSDGGAP